MVLLVCDSKYLDHQSGMGRCFDLQNLLGKVRWISLFPVIGSSENDVQLRTRHGRQRRKPPIPGHKGACISTFCTPIFNGFFRVHFHRFFAEQAQILNCFMAAASSEAGTTCSLRPQQ